MNKIRLLVPVMLKQSYRQSKKRSKKQKILTILGAIALAMYVAFIFYFSTKDQLLFLAQNKMSHSYLQKIFSSMSLYILVIALISTPSILYFSDDLEDYLAFPIQAETLASAKAITLYVSTIISLSFLYIPIGFVYAWVLKTGVLFVLKYLFLGLLLPLIPLALATSITVLLFRLFPKSKNEQVFTYLSTFLSLILVFVMIYKGGDTNASIVDTLGNFKGVNILFPNLSYYVAFLKQNRFVNFLLGSLITLPYLFITWIIFKTSYLDTALISSEASSKRKTKRKKVSYRSWRAYLQIDQKNILRTPVLAINYLLPTLIVPLSFFIPLFLSLRKEVNIQWEDLEFYRSLLYSMLDQKDLIMGSIAFPLIIAFFLTSMSSIASTSFSREGKNMTYFAALPIHYSKMFLAKYLLALKFAYSPLLILILIFALVLQLPLYLLMIALVTSLLGASVPILLGIFIDSLKPKLVWDEEHEAIKKNFIASIPAFIGLGLFFASIGLFVFRPYMTTAVIYLLLAIALNIVLFFVIRNYSERSLVKAIEKNV